MNAESQLPRLKQKWAQVPGPLKAAVELISEQWITGEIDTYEAKSCIDALESTVKVDGFVDTILLAALGRDIRVLRAAIQCTSQAPSGDSVRCKAFASALEKFGYESMR